MFGHNYIDRKMQHSALQCIKSSLWNKSLSVNFLTDHAECLVVQNMNQSSTYHMVRHQQGKWLICSTYSINKVLEQNSSVDDNTWAKFNPEREVTVTDTGNADYCHLQCHVSILHYYVKKWSHQCAKLGGGKHII